MEEIIEQCMEMLKGKAGENGYINPANVPRELVQITRQLVTDFTSRHERGLNGSPATVVVLPLILRAINQNLPLHQEDVDAIHASLQSMADIYRRDGREMAEDPSYGPPLKAAYLALERGE